jgi:hypothetical protein
MSFLETITNYSFSKEKISFLETKTNYTFSKEKVSPAWKRQPILLFSKKRMAFKNRNK